MKAIKNISLILFLLYIIGCSKKEEGIKHYIIDETTKEWVYYKTGSLWIYQDTISNVSDTIKIINDSFETIYHKQISSHDASYYYDLLKIEYNSNNYYSLSSEIMGGRGAMAKRFLNGSSHAYFDLEHFILGAEIDSHNSDGYVVSSTIHLNN